jgi:phosphoesterase RecJ-like protein
MAYDLGKALNIIFTPEISNHLYCAIVSDTGCFQFSNTNTRAFEVSYHLTKKGADPLMISEFIFHNNSPGNIKLLGRVLSRLKIFHGGKIAVITMFKDDLTDLKLKKEIDSEYITTLARSIKDTQIVLFFKEMRKNTFRVSIRSRGNANSAQVAEHFGGGGHLHAAGFTVTGNYDNLIKAVPEKVASLLKNKLNPDYSQAGIGVDANNIKH